MGGRAGVVSVEEMREIVRALTPEQRAALLHIMSASSKRDSVSRCA